MGLFLFSLAALAASLPFGATVATDPSATGPARRAPGAEASATVTVRILRHPARIGSSFGPPAPHMQPRAVRIEAADRTLVDALVYDFE